MKKFICTTTINPPTEALKRYARMKDWQLIVAGDIRTPHHDYLNMNLIYLSPKIQSEKYSKLSRLIGWNSIERRNFAILEAYERDADLIALIDDDNIPYDDWGEDLLIDKNIKLQYFTSDSIDVFDPIFVTDISEMWHRGFPIQLLDKRVSYYDLSVHMIPDIQANFWNGQPDIDAIYRISAGNGKWYLFRDEYFPFTTDLITPFNSQNTIISRRVIEDGYFLYPFIGRMSDIWIAYYITSKGYRVVYDKANVYQERNKHNLVEDLKQEMLGYEKSLDLINALLDNPEKINDFLPIESSIAWDEYRNIVEKLR